MTPETPLTEVAQHLPQRAAASLMDYDPEVQTAVLIMVRGIVANWEEQGVLLDPVAYDAVLSALTTTSAEMFLIAGTLQAEVVKLSSLLANAEQRLKEAGR